MKSEWLNLTVPNLLKELRKKVEEEFKRERHGDIKSPSIPNKKSVAVNVSDAKKFLAKGISVIVNKFNNSGAHIDEKILKDASLVIKSIEGEEELLEKYVPDFSSNKQARWPGPVGYRAIINHLVAVSIRVHSMHPDLPFDSIMRSVCRRIVVPTIAHNLTFIRKERVYLFNFLLKNDLGLEKLKKDKPININDVPIPKSAKTEESVENNECQKWIRLLNVLGAVMRHNIINFNEIINDIKRLALEHEVNPNGSSLWNELSFIASGDLSVDEILVSKVTAELDIPVNNNASKPIISCARARFGLLRYSYGMIDERELIMNNPAAALTKTKDYADKISSIKKIDDKLAVEGFGWAYLWSRYLLIKTDVKYRPKNTDQPGELIEQILSQIFLIADNDDYKKLAIRYLAGFLTNPRFIRPPKFLINQQKPEHYIRQMEKEPLPRGLVSLMRARVCLHKAYSCKETNPESFEKLIHESLKLYADTLNSINATTYAETMMDGEVSAWAIPEMRMCIELLKDTIKEKGNKKKSLISSLNSYQKALDIIGEMQFGVYFDKQEEEMRLESGLKMATQA